MLVYAIVRGITAGDDDETDKIIRVAFAIYFPMMLMIGFGASMGVYNTTCMQDKKSGMRAMLKAVGVTSLPYFTGLFLADCIIALIPNITFTIALLINPYLMTPAVVFTWSGMFIFFTSSVIVLSYSLSHLFDDPEISAKYTG